MTILPETHKTLRDAVSRGAFQDTPSPAARRGRRIAVGGTAAVLLGGGVAIAAGVWDPQLGSINDPVTKASSPVAVQTNGSLSVLERAQTDADRGAVVEQALARLSGAGIGEVDTSGVRLLGNHDGGTAVLAPVGRIGVANPAGEDLRRYKQLCVIYTTQTAATQKCGDTDDLRAGKITAFVMRDHDGIISGIKQSHTYGLVPDGVASVTITLQDRTTTTARVDNNFYDAATDSTAAPRDTTWLGANGQMVAPAAK